MSTAKFPNGARVIISGTFTGTGDQPGIVLESNNLIQQWHGRHLLAQFRSDNWRYTIQGDNGERYRTDERFLKSTNTGEGF